MLSRCPSTVRFGLGLCLTLGSLLLAPASARAAEPGLENISEGAARGAAERIACTSPQARRYLRHTLRDLEARRWGTMTASLQGDTVDLVADAVYAAASPGDHPGDVLRRFIGDSRGECRPEGRSAARRTLAQPDEVAPETEVDRCTRRPLRERRHDPACALAASVRSALDGDVATASAHVADVIAAATFDSIYFGKTLSEAQIDALYEHIAYELRELLLIENEETIDADVLHAFSNINLDGVRSSRCKDGDLLKDLAEGTVDAQDAFCSATRADLQTEKVAVVLTAPSGEQRKLNLTGILNIAIPVARQASPDRDVRVAEAILCELPLAPADRALADCSTGALKATKPGTFKLEIGTASWTIFTNPKEPRLRVESANHIGLASLVDGAVESLRIRADIGSLVRDKLLGEEPSAENLRELAGVALRLRRVARALDEAVLASGRHAIILGPLEALPTLFPRGPDAKTVPCEAATKPLDKLRCAASGPLRRLIIDAEDGHVRELASAVTSLVSPHDRSTCNGVASGRILEAFAANVPDVGDREDYDALGLEQLRGAAHDVAQCSPSERDDAAFKLSLVPTPGLRLSWNGAYLNAFGGDGFRVAPSLDVVSARLRLTPAASSVRIGLGVSILDVLAPLTELAMRRSDLRYDRQELLWLDVLRPRLDLTFGVPSVSRHLFLSAGFALRTVAPYRGGGAGNRPENRESKPSSTATYLAVGTPGGAAAESFASYVEYNLGVKYVF